MNKIALIFLLLFTFSVSAQDYKKLSDPKACKEGLAKRAAATKTLKADFSEKIVSSMLNAPIVGAGSMYYKNPDKIRWEHSKPNKQVVLINGKSFRMSENGKEVKKTGANMAGRKIQELMLQLLTGDFADEKDFSVEYSENTANYKLKLKPKNQRMSKYIEYIELVFDKKSMYLAVLTLAQTETDKMVYIFSNTVLNGEIADSKFTQF